MQYEKLTKEQFEALAFEFSQFLATQKIDKVEWENIKKTNANLTDELLCLFSDIVWDEVLQKASFAEHYSKHSVNLFQFNDEKVKRIVLQSNQINFLEITDFSLILKDLGKNSIEILQGSKTYKNSKKKDLFSLIKQGAILTDGSLFTYVNNFIN